MSNAQSPVPFTSTMSEHNNDGFFEAGSPGSKRCPTFKELADKIKQLEKENFQLKVRIYMGEQKSGVKMSSSDLGFFFPPSQQPQFQQFLQSQQQSSQSNTSGHSITANSETIKLQKEQLSMRVSELENKIHSYDILLKEKQKENTKLMEKNQDLFMQIGQLQTEVALARIELQQQEIPSTLKVPEKEDEIERGARIAFGKYYDLEEINAEMELKLQKQTEQAKELDLLCEERQHQIDSLLKKEEERRHQAEKDNQERQIEFNNVTKENQELHNKLKNCVKTYEQLGLKVIDLEEDNNVLNSKVDEYKQEIAKLRKAIVPEVVSAEKFTTICKLSEMLQTRVAELVAFIEALLILESQGVLTITGLTEPNRKNLREAVNHTGMLSQSLDDILGLKRGREVENRRTFNLANFFSNDCIHRSKSLVVSGKAAGDTQIPLKPIMSRSISSQCALLNPTYESSLANANNQVSKLRRELAKLEHTKERLTSEKSQLYARVVTLEANMNALKNCGNVDKRSTPRDDSGIAALILDKKILAERLHVSEAALTHLHQEHAKLVGELKVLRNSHAKEQLTDIPEKLVNIDGVRPSDSNSPDLGIDSGHDGAANSDDSNGNVFKAENRALRSANRELALKLRQTRQALDMTLEKLHSTTKQKEQVEKTICRQLHKTHTILRNAKKNLEKSASAQCQENIVP